MTHYYQTVTGNLNAGDIAKANDINEIQTNIQDSEKALLSDLHDNESYVLATGDKYKDSFKLTAAPKQGGYYIDSYNTFDEESDFLNINLHNVRQPILKTKTSLYSIITKFRNTTNKDIPVVCELQEENGRPIRTTTITLLANQEVATYEVIFDLDFYPTNLSLDYESLKNRDGADIPANGEEESYNQGYKESEDEESTQSSASAGVSKIYFVIKKLGLNMIDLVDSGDETPTFNPDTSLGVYCQKGSDFPDNKIYAEVGDLEYTQTEKNIYYLDIYANEMTYLCTEGTGIIAGQKITCLDSHISIEGGSSVGNVLTQVYLGTDGHLHASNRKASFTTNIEEFEFDEDDRLPVDYLPIALILTYSNAQYGLSKEPLIIQDDYGQLPRSHHERLRRLEKQMNWSNDIALPARIKYTLSDEDWIDKNGEDLSQLPHTTTGTSGKNKDKDKLDNKNIFLSPDTKGNLVAQISEEKTDTILITLKERLKDSDGKEIKLSETDALNSSSFSNINHMVHDSKTGTITLETEKTDDNSQPKTKTVIQKKVTKTKTPSKSTYVKKISGSGNISKQVEKAKKEAQQILKNSPTKTTVTTTKLKYVDFNPWDDAKANRPNGEIKKPIVREYKVVSGKNGEHDRDSSYPGMTLYAETNYRLKKLTIPIRKFQNCESVRFYIWRRQDKNIKTNNVGKFSKKQLIYTSKPFSLKKAKVKGKYQYMKDGFTIEFEKGGLTLKKGQYVIVALPKPKSGTGSLFTETFKPKNSKDFCIRYTGAANASTFDIGTTYQEVWYNSASATAAEENYYKKGSIVSKVRKWTGAGLERIKSVKPIIGKNLTLGNKSKDSYSLYVSTGGKWIKVTPGKENPINDGGATTFRWKLEFNGDGKSTPKLAYNKSAGYAIKFILKREKPAGFIQANAEDKNKNMCITSKDIGGDEVLREYIGDMNFGTEHSRFEGFEFARVWADEDLNGKLQMDIQASDKKYKYKTKEVDLWSLHYCDLNLDDFEKISVDYSDYTQELEYDEHNMRLKLDSEHSYNDNDIQFLSPKEFSREDNDIDDGTRSSTQDSSKPIFSNKTTVKENQLFLRKRFENPIDLTKYTGLKFKINTEIPDSTGMSLQGLGIYISSTYESEVPSNNKNLPDNLHDTVLQDSDVIPKVIDPDENPYEYYEGKIIQIVHAINPDSDGDKIYKPGFFQYVKVFDSTKNKFVWKREQIYDLRTYSIYEIGEIKTFDDENSFDVRIEIDQKSNNLKNVKEIGLISLNDEDKYKVSKEYKKTKLSAELLEEDSKKKIKITLKDESEKVLDGKITWGNNTYSTSSGVVKIEPSQTGKGTLTFSYAGETKTVDNTKVAYAPSSISVAYDFSGEEKTVTGTPTVQTDVSSVTLSLDSIRAISEEVLKIYDPENLKVKPISTNTSVTKIYTHKPEGSKAKGLQFNTTTYATNVSDAVKGIHATTPATTQICLAYKDGSLKERKTVCYINNPFQGTLTQYKHIGIQLAADVYIPKDSLKINICSEKNGVNPIASVNLPTFNSIYYPNQSLGTINLSQIFKKLNISDDEEINSISIETTPYFQEFMKDLLDENTKSAINLFLGKIVLYRARTIPIYHNKMRFKFYSTTNGEIDHYTDEVTNETINIRKIGAVLDYD